VKRLSRDTAPDTDTPYNLPNLLVLRSLSFGA